MNKSSNAHNLSSTKPIRRVPCRAAILLAITVAFASVRAANHPLDPLDATEIVTAAQILLDGGAATPGAAFQSVELREPSKETVLGFHPGDPLNRSATVDFRQNKQSYRSIVNLSEGTFSPPVTIPKSQGQLLNWRKPLPSNSKQQKNLNATRICRETSDASYPVFGSHPAPL